MAGNPNPSHATRFKKGNKVGGRRKGLLRSDDVKATLSKFWHLSKSQLRDVLESDKTTMGELMIAAVMAKAAKDGDASRLSFLLDRVIGRVKPEPEDAVVVEPFVIHVRDGTRLELGARAKEAG